MRIAIASGKGGTGKTTISTALAELTAEKYKTALFDLDVEEPNSGIFLDKTEINSVLLYKDVPKIIRDKCTFCGICDNTCNFNAILRLRNDFLIFDNLCHSCYACAGLCPNNAITMEKSEIGKMTTYQINENFIFIETVMNIGIEQSTPLIKQAVQKSKEISSDYDFLYFDAPPGTSCPAVAATKEMDYVILAAEPTLFGFNDMKLAIKMLNENQIPFGIIINKDDGNFPDIETYCSSEKVRIIEKIDLDIEIARKYSTGENILLKEKKYKQKKSLCFEHKYIEDLKK